MSLKNFLVAHHDELVSACEAELAAGSSREQLSSYFAALLASLSSGSQAAGPSPVVEGAIIGTHPSVSRARISVDQLSRRSRTPVLLLGEFGTGKWHCARALHATTYPEGELFELKRPEGVSELERRVGRLRTRTSSDATAGLTVFVRNLHEASPQVQTSVSRLLLEQGLQLRIVASSTRSLTQACREGTLRSDLVFGFPTIIELAPLRERSADIPELVRHFAELGALPGQAPPVFADSALQLLGAHAWQGNLAELKNLVQRVCDEGRAGAIEAEHLPELNERATATRFSLPSTGVDLAELERELLIQALSMAENNQSRAARLLGLTRDQIRYRLAKFDLLQSARG